MQGNKMFVKYIFALETSYASYTLYILILIL